MSFILKHFLGETIHEGTQGECEMILKAFVTYGLSQDKFEIVNDAVTTKTYGISYDKDGDITFAKVEIGPGALKQLIDHECVHAVVDLGSGHVICNKVAEETAEPFKDIYWDYEEMVNIGYILNLKWIPTERLGQL